MHTLCSIQIAYDGLKKKNGNLDKGIDNLRVADASVMPDLIAGNTNAPTIMLAEMCADEILCSADTAYSKLNAHVQ